MVKMFGSEPTTIRGRHAEWVGELLERGANFNQRSCQWILLLCRMLHGLE